MRFRSTAQSATVLLCAALLIWVSTAFDARGAEYIVQSQAELDAALLAAADGDTVLLGDNVRAGVARVRSGVLLKNLFLQSPSLTHLDVMGVDAPVVVEGVLFTGFWSAVHDPPDADPPENRGCVVVDESNVTFRDCRFDELYYIITEPQKLSVPNIGVIALSESQASFLDCYFHWLGGSDYTSDLIFYGGIRQIGSGTTTLEDTVVESVGMPIVAEGPVFIDRCTFRDCGPGLFELESDLVLTNSLIVASGPSETRYCWCSGGPEEFYYAYMIQAGAEVLIENNTFVDNPILYRDLGDQILHPSPAVRHPLIHLEDTAHGSVARNIFVGQGGPALHAPSSVVVECNDAYESESAFWSGGIGDVIGIDGNISEAPIFCGRTTGDYTLSVHSPAATADCGLMGAFPTNCNRESPVAIQGFTASWEGAGVLVRWELAGEEAPEVLLERLDARGLHEIYRGREGGHLDLDPPEGELFRYALGFIRDGERQSALAWAIPTGEPLARRTRLIGAVPNPFNPRTEIRFELAEPGDVRLEIFDAAGRRVKGWWAPGLGVGSHSVLWYGLDESETKVASGVYYLRLDVEGKLFSERLVLLR